VQDSYGTANRNTKSHTGQAPKHVVKTMTRFQHAETLNLDEYNGSGKFERDCSNEEKDGWGRTSTICVVAMEMGGRSTPEKLEGVVQWSNKVETSLPQV
jgi:hypothetical protein